MTRLRLLRSHSMPRRYARSVAPTSRALEPPKRLKPHEAGRSARSTHNELRQPGFAGNPHEPPHERQGALGRATTVVVVSTCAPKLHQNSIRTQGGAHPTHHWRKSDQCFSHSHDDSPLYNS